MWVAVLIMILILMTGEAVFFLWDRMPWNRRKKK